MKIWETEKLKTAQREKYYVSVGQQLEDVIINNIEEKKRNRSGEDMINLVLRNVIFEGLSFD